MKKIKNNLKYVAFILLLLVSATVSSCSDWLDTQPSNQTSADKLFSTEKGFQEALSGAYTLMTKAELYGKEMTFGFTDVIAQQWLLDDVTNTSPYFGAKAYDFESELTRKLTEDIWLAQYNVIANVNDILAFVDARKNVFNNIGYNVIKGEALALRAYLHFDMLRLFAPNDFALNKETKYIPYVDQFSKNLTASMSAKEVVTKCLADLDAAAELLKSDPIYTNIENEDFYYKNRTVHMNYYAVKALIARINIYIGEKEKALKAAKEVIAAQNNGLFRWVNVDEATSTSENLRDYTFSSEHIFGLNVKKLVDHIKGSFVYPYNPILQNRKYCKTKTSDISTLFAEEPDDYRTLLYKTEEGIEKMFVKFKQVEKSKTRDRMPMIRISEMYYIAAECSTDATEALGYLNTIRDKRNIKTLITDKNKLTSELYKEYQKEFTGEGQLFYFYKRLNIKIEASNDNYTFTLPLPRVELDLGGRPRPEKI